jgi:hypothetical protein
MNIETSILIALIASVTSLAVAFFTFLYTRANQRDIERIKAQFAEEKSEKDARRDYEYEARKRLYQECEPLFFQLAECSETALFQIQSLAERSREGNLESESEGYLSKNSYYLKSTIYNLLKPLVIYKLVHSRLTLIDLQVDAKIRLQYVFAKLLYRTFTRDMTIAALDPKLQYHPYDENWRELRKHEPQEYYRQGFTLGRLDNALDSFIQTDDKGINSIISFGRFEEIFETVKPEHVNSSLGAARDVFFQFHPQKRPVLWRELICQAHVYQCLLNIKDQDEFDEKQAKKYFENVFSDIKEREKFDWRIKNDVEDKKVLVEPFQVAKQFLRSEIKF